MHEVLKDFNRIEAIVQNIELCKKEGTDHRANKGAVQKIIDKYHPARIKYKVIDVIDESKTARTIRLSPVGGYLPPFQAGQYINIFVQTKGIMTSRPYSISSSPNQIGYYDITVRRTKDGFVSNYLLEDVKIGDILESTSPAGTFYYNPIIHGNSLVFIAGGCGITPFISMLRNMYEKGDQQKHIELVYGCVSADDVLFEAELNRIQEACPNFKWHLVVSEPNREYKGNTGFITAELLLKILENPISSRYYLCGPCAMYDSCQKQLMSMGISIYKIKQEMQSNPTDPGKLTGWPESIASDSTFKVTVNGESVIEVRATETLMNSLERNQLIVPASCRAGECSLCRTKLIAGNVFYPDTVKLRKSDKEFGYIHPCSSYPLSDLTIQI